MKSFFNTSIISLLFFIIFIFSPSTISAASIGVYPPILRANVFPGKSFSQVFRIDNNSTSEHTYIARLIPFTSSDLDGNPLLDPNTRASWLSYFSLANSHIEFDKPFTIKPNSSEQLVISFSPPLDAYSRDHYLTLLITQTDTITPETSGPSIQTSIGANLIITVNQNEYPQTSLSVTDLSLIRGTYLKIGNIYLVDNITPLELSVTIKNSGDYAAETRGTLKITNNFNQIAFIEGILPQTVLSQSERHLQSIKQSPLQFTPQVNQIGLHHLELAINSPNATASTRQDIFLFPFKISFGILIALFFIITGIRYRPN